VVVHVCGDDYENGSGSLAKSQADGDVTARWKHQREKDVSQEDRY